MPISDFLATAGRGTAVGQVAEAFGGRTRGQSTLDNFIDKDLPAFAEQFKAAQSQEEIAKIAGSFIPAALKAGVPPAGIDKLSDMLTGPALQNLRSGEYDKIISEYGPQKTPLTPMVAPEGQGQPLAPDTTFTPQETPGKPFDQQAALRLGKFGGIPAGLSGLLRTPAEVAMDETSRAATEEKVKELQQREKGIAQFSNIPPPGGMVSPQQMARHNPAGLPQFNPQRELSGGAMDLKEQGLKIQRERLEALKDRVESGAATAAERAELARQRLELERAKFEHAKQGTETVTEAPGSPKESRQAQIILTDQAIEAGLSNLPPAEQAAGIKKLASDMGYEIDGDPRLGVVPGSGFLGSNKFGNVGILGITGMKKKAKTVTRAPASAAPAAAPAAGGKKASKRLKFDMEGNQID